MTLIERISDRIPGLGVKLAYGELTTVGGEEFVPVAIVGYGFGAGEGSGTAGEDEAHAERQMSGSGGGGGGLSLPIGAYVRRAGRLAFRPNPVALLIFGLPVAAVVIAGIAVIARGR